LVDSDKGFRIGGVYAFCAVGSDNEEGIVGFRAEDGTWMPLIGSDRVRVELLWPTALLISQMTGQSIRLLKFTERSEVAIIQPGDTMPCPV
jgi:hypothetical protein